MNGEAPRTTRFLPLTEATYLILISLAEAQHGYGIMATVAAATANEVRVGPGTLYGALTKLLEQGLIERAVDNESGGQRRKLYRLTSLGQEVAAAETARLDALAQLGRRALEAANRGAGRGPDRGGTPAVVPREWGNDTRFSKGRTATS